MKRVLVTGANGFVCSNIVTALIKHGYFVYALDLYWDNPVVHTWSQQAVELITSDCVSIPDYQLDGLVHGAAITAEASELGMSPENYFDAHLQPMLAMSRYAAKNVSGRSIFISSSGVYREIIGLIDETTPTTPSGLYAVAKQTTESLIETLKFEHQRDVCCIRLGNVYGKNEFIRESRPRVSFIRQMIESALTDNQITVYTNLPEREWTFATDIGNAVVQLLKKEKLTYALYNIAAAEKIEWHDIASTIASKLSGITIDEAHYEIPSTARFARNGILDNRRLRDDASFSSWTSFQDGIYQTIESLQQESHHA